MRPLGLLNPIEHRDGGIGTGNLRDILAMQLPGIIIRAHGNSFIPSDTGCWVSIIEGTIARQSMHTYHN